MKKKSLFQMMQEGMEARLRRLCGRIPAHLRLYVVLTMLLFFALLVNLLKYYDYVPIQKKDGLRYEHLA